MIRIDSPRSVCEITSTLLLDERPSVTNRFSLPRSGWGKQPRVAALRGYPGKESRRIATPNGVVSVSWVSSSVSRSHWGFVWEKKCHNLVGVGGGFLNSVPVTASR